MGISFADDPNDPNLILKCRMLEDGVKTDIFYEHDLNQSFLFKILKYNKNEIAYKYDNSSTIEYIFNRDTKLLTSVDKNQISNYAICNDTDDLKRVILESNKKLAWKIKDKYLKPECLSNSNLDVWDSFDNYQEYFTRYLGKEAEDPLEDKEFINFYTNIGLYLNKEIPLNDKFAPSWNGDLNNNEGVLSITMQVDDCLVDEPLTKIKLDGFSYSYTVVDNIDLKEAKKLAPNIDQEFLSIKSIKTSSHSMAIFGILNLDNKLIMVPLKILNTW